MGRPWLLAAAAAATLGIPFAVASAPSPNTPSLLEDRSTCAASYSKCKEGGLPDNFCCPSTATCMPLAANTTVLCCPSGSDCAEIVTISCNIGLQNATAYPTAQVKTSALTESLPACNGNCCPFGYSCNADGNCAKDADQTEEPGASGTSGAAGASGASTGTAEPTAKATVEPTGPAASKTLASVPAGGATAAVTAAPDTSPSSSASSSGSGSSKAPLIGGLIGAVAAVAVIIALVMYCRKRKQGRDQGRKSPHASLSSRNISRPLQRRDDWQIGRHDLNYLNYPPHQSSPFSPILSESGTYADECSPQPTAAAPRSLTGGRLHPIAAGEGPRMIGDSHSPVSERASQCTTFHGNRESCYSKHSSAVVSPLMYGKPPIMNESQDPDYKRVTPWPGNYTSPY